MRLTRIVPALLLAAGITAPRSAEAMVFGKDETVHRIQKLERADYYLCHKTTMHFFLAGIYVSDDGYVPEDRRVRQIYTPAV